MGWGWGVRGQSQHDYLLPLLRSPNYSLEEQVSYRSVTLTISATVGGCWQGPPPPPPCVVSGAIRVTPTPMPLLRLKLSVRKVCLPFFVLFFLFFIIIYFFLPVFFAISLFFVIIFFSLLYVCATTTQSRVRLLNQPRHISTQSLYFSFQYPREI